MKAPSKRTIATRRLFYTSKEDSARKSFTVCINEPYLLTKGSVDFDFSEGTAGCVLSFIGLPETEMTVYGADSVQALELAVASMEAYLLRLSKKYEFYFEDGAPYFE